MGLSRLDNFLKSVRGNIIYVDPNSLDSTDSIQNQGSSLTRPFKTIQRALIESARFSYQQGLNNDRFAKTTILLYPGDHLVDNRPGWIPDGVNNFRLRNGTTSNDFSPFDLTTSFNLVDPNNQLYKLNSVNGGVIIPRGTSIVGLDLRKTKIRPLYVPNPVNNNIERSCIFRVTGACYLWQFSIFDADPNGTCYIDYTSNTFVPNFSHHKLSCFEYADGVNDVNINDIFQTYPTDRTDLEMYYEKVGLAYGQASGRGIEPDYPSAGLDIQPKIDEYRIVGSAGESTGISSIRAGNGTVSSSIITVTTTTAIPGLDVDTPFRITGITAPGYNGQFVVTEKLSDTELQYQVQNAPSLALPSVTGSSLILQSDTVTSASPYIFNITLRSVFGMCGLLADGDKATGFKSMMVAQFTGIGLQKDDSAFVLYDNDSGAYQDSTVTGNETISTNSRSIFKPEYRNFHIKAINDAFIQNVSVFAIGCAEHFSVESGGDMSITNSNSNFGAKALVADGFRRNAFPQDDQGYITHIIPPKEFSKEEKTIEFNAIDVNTTVGVASTGHLYLYDQTNPDVLPENVLGGYRIGARENDTLKVLISSGGTLVEYSSRIVMPGSQVSSEKEFLVGRSVGINSITNNILTLTTPHTFINGESIRILGDSGQLPDGMTPNTVYYAITSGIGTNQVKIAKTQNDAISATSLNINAKGGTLKVISRVSDKNPGDTGHPIQFNSTQGQWYINVSTSNNTIYSTIVSLGSSVLGEATPRTYFNRLVDDRNVLDTVYRVRYVLPKNSPTTARPPVNGFILQESNDIIGSGTNEISQLYSGSGSISSTNLRNPKFIATASWSSSVVTVRSELPHGLKVGDEIEIVNVSPTGYNGTYTVTSIISAKEFTYALGTSPGAFSNDTSNRSTTLPYFRRKKYNKTYQVYKTEEIQPYVFGSQDGIYYLTLINHSNSPTVTPFSNQKFAQPIENLYPQTNKDNPNSDPNASDSHALPSTIGEVVVNDPQNSITKETLESFVVGYGITNIQSSSGTAHTIYTTIDHGLSGITSASIVSGGSAYGSSGSFTGDLYNARLVGFAGSTTGSNATAKITLTSGAITGVTIIDGGSAYGIGNTLTVVGIATTTSHVIGVVRVETISNNIGDTLKVSGVSSASNSAYNTLYRVSGISTGQSKEIDVISAETFTVFSTTGLGVTVTSNASYLPTGKVLSISSLSYNSVTSLATVEFTTSHGFGVDNKISIRGANESVFNGDFIVTRLNNLTSLVVNVGVETSSTTATGTLYAYRPTLTSYGGDLIKSSENISGRLNYQYAGITTTIENTVTLVTNLDTNDTEYLIISNAISLGLTLGDYLLVNNEIFKIRKTVTSNSVNVYRALLGSPRQNHAIGSVVRRIKVTPVELRRNSTIRASGHTFEYLGFGPGNYSTSLPDKQDRALSNSELFLAQATKTDGGVVVYTGMNSDGDFFAGNKKTNSSTGKEETYDTPISTSTGENDTNILNNITDTQRLFVEASIKVDGGNDKNTVSQFDGPVVFNNKITSNSDIETNSILLQGEEEVSRKFSISDVKPTIVGNYGDIEFNSTPQNNENVGWIYTTNNEWKPFGWINDSLYGVGISTNGITVGLSTLINFTGSGVEISGIYDSVSGISTLNFNVTSAFSGYSNVAGIASYADNAGIATYATNAGIATYATNAGIATYATNAGIATDSQRIQIYSIDGNSNDGTTYVTLVANNATGFQTSFIDSDLVYNANTSTLNSINFVGTLLGNATSANTASTSAFSGYSNVAGIATFATYASNAGIATFATNAGIATFATNAGIATFATNAGIATFATNAGVSTNILGGSASQIPYQSASNTTSFIPNGTSGQILRSNGTSVPSWTSNLNVGIITASEFRGGVFFGDGSGLTGITASGTGLVIRDNGVTVGTAGTIDFGDRLSVSAISAGICTVTSLDFVSIAGFASTAGISTFASTAGISTVASNISLVNESLDSDCFVTFSNDATGNRQLKTNINLKYNSVSDILTVGTVNGSVNVANQLKTQQIFTNSNLFLTFVDTNNTSSTPENLYTYSTLYFNPVQGTLSVPTFVGNLNGVASNATNIQGGSASQIPYQSALNTTSFIPNGTSGQILRSNGTSVPSWTSNLNVGIITATQFRGGSFFGDGSGLTGIVASGTGIIIRDDGVTVGTAGTINFGIGLDVSPISAGSVTVTVGTVTNATNATNANNINISATTSTDTTTSLVLVGNQATGNQSPFIDSGLTYDANVNSLTASTFVGNLTGNATSATSANTANTALSATNADNATNATNLTGDGSNWSTNGRLTAVVGQLAWRNFGNGHTIFDASASLSPAGGAVNNSNSQIAWSGTYPTLMGWNGTNTYGVRVDSARNADLLDGIDSTSFARVDSTSTFTVATYFRSNLGATSGSLNSPPLQAYATGGNSAFMSFHRVGSFAVNFGLDSDNVLRIGGWSASANRWQLDMSGNMSVAGDITAFVSDIRLKTNIEPIENALGKVLSLSGFTYNFNEIGKELGFDVDIRHSGVSAQDIQKVLPEAVCPAPANEDYLTVKYEKLVPLLIEAIKDQNKQIEELKNRICKLEG
jgi:hypothetical protein